MSTDALLKQIRDALRRTASALETANAMKAESDKVAKEALDEGERP